MTAPGRACRALKIAIAPDSFKGSLTAEEAADCMEAGFRRVYGRRISVVKIPMADGGEGTVRAVVAASGGRLVKAAATDPLGRRIRAEYGLIGDGHTAVIEVAAASGLPLLQPHERNPLLATSRGTGELLRHAVLRGAKTIVLGLGGSATVDGGMGLAQALGIRFLDARGVAIGDGGGALGRVSRIDVSGLMPELRDVRIEIACDVTNPLCGRNGAARIYGPQKGAPPAMVRHLETGLQRLGAVVRKASGQDWARYAGAGAAGGMAVPLLAFCNAQMGSGVDLVMRTVGLEERLAGCDLVITGEGRIDGQTARGKTPVGVARTARKLGLPVIAICGSAGPGVHRVYRMGIDAVFTALQRPVSDAELAKEGREMLIFCSEQVARLLALSKRITGV
jgi:glycerate kinase